MQRLAKIIIGDIITTDCDCLLSQENTQSQNFAGLAKKLTETFSHGNPHLVERTFRTAKIAYAPTGSGIPKQPNIVHLFAQIYPGPPKGDDTVAVRVSAFEACLRNLRKFFADYNLDPTIAIPVGIGCGLAQGDWNVYRELIYRYLGCYRITYYALSEKYLQQYPPLGTEPYFPRSQKRR